MRIVLFACLSASLFAQQPAAPPATAAQGQRPAPKNLKLLKPDEIRAAMQSYTVALGVQCTFCHVKGDMASDDNEHKVIARTMIEMTRDINAKLAHGDDKARVSCYTCHRGAEHHPITAPPPPPAAADGAPPQPPK